MGCIKHIIRPKNPEEESKDGYELAEFEDIKGRDTIQSENPRDINSFDPLVSENLND